MVVSYIQLILNKCI